jgi:hypothetical protein
MAAFKLMPYEGQGVEPGQLHIEVGLATYTTTSTSVAFRTTIANVHGGVVNLVNDATIATDEKSFYSIPIGAVTSNSITISRSSHQAIYGAVISVMIWGTKSSQ